MDFRVQKFVILRGQDLAAEDALSRYHMALVFMDFLYFINIHVFQVSKVCQPLRMSTAREDAFVSIFMDFLTLHEFAYFQCQPVQTGSGRQETFDRYPLASIFHGFLEFS